MAAGNNVYSIEKDTIQQDGTLYDLFYAKELSAYGSVDNVKALFYLDYVFQSVVAGENVFVGGVRENSNNYYYHKNTRQSVFGLHADGVNYIMLNDAGLNTFASINVSIKDGVKFANYILLNINYQSAYYSATHEAGAYFRILNVAGVEIYTFSMRANTWTAGSKQSVSTILIMNQRIQGVKQGYNAQITPYTSNDEGEFRGDMLTIVLDDFLANFLCSKISDLFDNPADNTNASVFCTETDLKELGHIYKDNSGMWDIMLYSNPQCTIPIENGLYNTMYSSVDGEIYAENELGAYKGNKAVLQVFNGRPQMWTEGRWTPPAPKKEIFVSATAQNTNGNWKYEIEIRNDSLAPVELFVQVHTYKNVVGSSNIEIFKKLGEHNISCEGNSQFTYVYNTLPISAAEIAIGILDDGVFAKNVQISEPSMILQSPPTEH